jgi:hypothetical protein
VHICLAWFRAVACAVLQKRGAAFQVSTVRAFVVFVLIALLSGSACSTAATYVFQLMLPF